VRRLATIRRISDIQPIPGADNIEVATVDGWKVVVKKDEYDIGDVCVYLEIDSWVPHTLAPFLTAAGKEPKEYKGIKGQRLRTVKLRGQISQGLILPVSVLKSSLSKGIANQWANEDQDVSQELGVIKYDRDEEEDNKKKRNVPFDSTRRFPTHLFPKTDQERIQNCFFKLPKEDTWEATLKLDGSSCSIFHLDGQLRVCSRNLELKVKPELSWWQRLLLRFNLIEEPKAPDNHFVKMALQVEDKVKQAAGLVFQGELMGPGIQKNREEFKEFKFFVYDVFDIENQAYLSPSERRSLVSYLGLDHVPVIDIAATLYPTVEEHLAVASSTKSINHPIGEGIVYKSNRDSSLSFKAISNKYLLKEE